MSPQRLFRVVAFAEAVTWAMLLTGMFLKYATDTTEVGVTIAGPIHGFAFVAYVVTTVVVAIDAKWPVRRTLLGLLAAVPPFVTIWFDLAGEKRGFFRDSWRLRDEAAAGPTEKLVAWLVTKPLQGLGAGVVAVCVLFGVALVAGPPAG